MRPKLFVVLCVVGSMGIAAAQTPQPLQNPTFKAGVTLVQVDVSVLDKKTHRPVRGLTAADFSVFEDGHPQTIAAFAAVDVPDPQPLPTVDGKPVTWLRDVASDVQSNASAGKPESRLFVMLIDDAMIPGDPWMIRQAKKAAHSVIEKLSPVDRMAVVLSMESGSVQDFTSDKSKLNAAVEKLTTGYATYYFGWDNASSSNRMALQGSSQRGAPSVIPPSEPGNDSDVQLRDASYSTLVDIADALMSAPERRKALVYISPGVSMNPFAPNTLTSSQGMGRSMVDREANIRLAEELPEIFRRMQRANINIYPIDPGGLDGIAGYVANRLGALSIDRRPKDPLRVGEGVQDQMTNFLRSAANSTGGLAIVNTNDVEPGIQQIFLENGSFYLLGYQPPPKDPPGTLHRLKVEVNRKDVEVRTRSGYYTPKPEKIDPRRPAATPMQKAIAHVLPSADLPLRVALAPFAAPGVSSGSAPKQPRATVAIVLGLERPAPEQPLSDTVEIVTSAFTPDGVAHGSQNQTAHVALRPASAGDVVHYEALSRMDLAPGRYQLRIAAHSAASDATGSVFADVEIPDFAKAPLSLSGMLLSLDPPVASAPRDAFAAITTGVPTAERTFQPRDRVTAFLRVYQGGSAALAPVGVTVRILNEHDVAVVNRADSVALDRFDTTTRAADYRVELPLVTLDRGPYLLTLEAALGKEVARREVRFEVR